MRLLISLAAAIALASGAFAQERLDPAHDPLVPRFQVNKTTVLSSAAEKITVQATTASASVNFEQVDVTCTVAAQITFYENGTAATATTLAVTQIGPASAVLPAAFSSSNVGTGTTLKTFPVAANVPSSFDLSAFSLPANGGGAYNFSVGTSSISGTCTIQIQGRQLP